MAVAEPVISPVEVGEEPESSSDWSDVFALWKNVRLRYEGRQLTGERGKQFLRRLGLFNPEREIEGKRKRRAYLFLRYHGWSVVFPKRQCVEVYTPDGILFPWGIAEAVRHVLLEHTP